MIQVKITTADYNKVKYGGYIKEYSFNHTWLYPTENPLVLLMKGYGYAYLFICKDKNDYKELVDELIEDKKKYTETAEKMGI